MSLLQNKKILAQRSPEKTLGTGAKDSSLRIRKVAEEELLRPLQVRMG